MERPHERFTGDEDDFEIDEEPEDAAESRDDEGAGDEPEDEEGGA